MQQVREEAKRESAQFYLQLVGIIQSFALGFLLLSVRDNFETVFLPLVRLESVTAWLQVATVFQAIVMTWTVNVTNAMIFHRVVGITDSYIPFVFSIPQFLLITLITPSTVHWWFYALTFLTVVSVWAYTDMYRKDERESENDSKFATLDAYKVVGIRYRDLNRLYIGSVGALFALIGVLLHGCLQHPAWSAAFALLANVLFGLFTVFHVRAWRYLTAKESNA